MTGRTFGRRGIIDSGPAVPRAAFGHAPVRAERMGICPQPDSDDELATRRAAFLAEERRRKAEGPPPEAADDFVSPRPTRAGPIIIREKSLPVAYVLWFFAGAIGAHRFYLGTPVSGMIQLTLWVINLAMLMSGQYAAVVGLFAAAIWLLVDGFLILGLHRKACERARGVADYAATFA
jgi:TM2 domain-containing membrane protein YozV